MTYLKPFFIWALLGAISITAWGCGKAKDQNDAFATKQRDYSIAYSSSVLTYNSAATPNPKIFLVAGSLENANFAQEIIVQKRLWLRAGIPENQIECFYTLPYDSEFRSDEAQYRSLSPDLAYCRPANPSLILDELRRAASKNPDFIYLYVTSHGASPAAVRKGAPEAFARFSFLNQYWISVDADKSGMPADFNDKLRLIGESGVAPDQLFFTPRYLKAALKTAGPTTKLITVLQACHSGGFLDTPIQELKPDLLSSLPLITMITASREDRSSFGCNPGADQTTFGGIFNSTLETQLQSPLTIDWSNLFGLVRAQVESTEASEGVESSFPQFFKNF